MMETGEFLFLVVQEMTDMVRRELEARGVPYSLRPMVMDGVCNRLITEAYDHLVAVRAKEAQEAIISKPPVNGKEPPSEAPKAAVHTASVEEFLESIKRDPAQVPESPRPVPQKQEDDAV